jgi:hypothetical protein
MPMFLCMLLQGFSQQQVQKPEPNVATRKQNNHCFSWALPQPKVNTAGHQLSLAPNAH